MNIANIIKQHRYESVCVILCVLLLAGLYPAAKLGSKVQASAKDAQALNDSLARLQRPATKDGVANQSLLDAKQKALQLVKAEAEKSINLFIQENQRPFLMPGFFPEADESARWNYRPAYKKALEALYDETLRAYWPDYQAKKEESEIGVYVNKDAEEGFYIGSWVEGSNMPDLEDCWFGQLSLWIHKDVAEVVRQLNDRSAQDRGEQPSVANASVKRIISVDVDTYYYIGSTDETQQIAPSVVGGPAGLGSRPNMGLPGMGQPPGGFGAGAPVQPKARITSAKKRKEQRLQKKVEVTPFTEHVSDDDADVLHFTISVIIDSRRVNEFLEEISRKNLYTILSVNLSREDIAIDTSEFPRFSSKNESFSPNEDMVDDLIYGGDPVVRLDIEAEALFLKDVYAQIMPEEVKSILQDNQSLVKSQLKAIEDQREKARRAAEKAAKKAARKSKKKK